VVVVGGQFNVVLGAAGGTEITPSSVNDIAFAFTDPERYLQMTVVSGPGITTPQTLSPRQQILSTPFALQALHGVPAGTVVPFAGTTIPEGWELCDGLPRDGTESKYARLFAAIGTTYGGSGTTFNKPDLRGRTAIGVGQGPQLTNRTLSQKVGEETHTLSISEMPSHSHGVTDPGHRHTLKYGKCAWSGTTLLPPRFDSGFNFSTTTEAAFTGISINDRGDGQAHNVMQPSIVLNYIIKL
jgi:microcystin-dependent protein